MPRWSEAQPRQGNGVQSPFEGFADESTGTVFRDVILLALIGFVAMVIMLLPHVRKAEEETEDHRAPGNVIVEIHWPSEMAYDVDLWVRAPQDVPVGFYNQGSEYFNLLRDDLGRRGGRDRPQLRGHLQPRDPGRRVHRERAHVRPPPGRPRDSGEGRGERAPSSSTSPARSSRPP